MISTIFCQEIADITIIIDEEGKVQVTFYQSNNLNHFKINRNDLKQKPQKVFNSSGLTIDDCIKMCLEHDKTVLSNKKHPLTEDQVKQNLANKNKQEEMKKMKKSKNEEFTIIN